MKKRIIASIMTLVMLLGITACGKSGNNDKVELTMYLWDKTMTTELTPWLEQQDRKSVV